MHKYDLKETISGKVKFMYYRDKELWYKTHNGFSFGVPIEDTGTATFNAEDKGIFFMRWIAPALKEFNKSVVFTG